MRGSIKNFLKVAGMALLTFFSGCMDQLPEVTTHQIENITSTMAKSGGEISSRGKSKIISSGICWDTISNPTTGSNVWYDSLLQEKFSVSITGLFPGQTYYLRSFAVNSLGTSYGEEISFTTLPSVPVLTTAVISEISVNSAKSGGLIITDGGKKITEYGICWSTSPEPTVSDSRIADKTGNKEFISEIKKLMPDRKYYVRAYATNSIGTGYGESKEFNTRKKIPLSTVFTINEIYLHSASVNVKSITLDGNRIPDYGVCWNTRSNPTVENFKLTKQYKPGRLRLTGLKAGTRYYIRFYTLVDNVILYGREASFTSMGKPPAVETLGAYDLTETGAKFKAKVNPGFLPTTITFEYGINENYGQIELIPGSPLKGGSDSVIIATVSGLKAGTRYHFRAKASNDLGTTYGRDSSFIMLVSPELKNFTPIVKNYRDSVFYINPPVSNSPGTFTYTSSNPDIAVINGDKGVIKGSGICTITATQQPSGKYTAGSVTTTFSMNVVDIDGNAYQTVAIGDQDWMKENLKVTRYRNGEPIPNITETAKWTTLTTGAFCWMQNDTTNRVTRYGALYNWYAVSDPRRICPTGWHVPTDAEWQVMERFLGMTFAEADETVKRGADQGLQLKDSTGWVKDGNGTNSSEFSGLPAGIRLAESGEFHNIGADACWWTNTEEDAWNAWMRNMYYYYNSIYRIPDLKASGFSVRCVRDRRR